MRSPSPSIDDLLFDASTLQPFQHVSVKATQSVSEQRPFLTPDAELKEVSQGEVRAVTPLEARRRLNDLMAQPETREQLMLELGQVVPDRAIFQHLAPLLGASNAEEFAQSLITWTGTNQPEALEGHLQALQKNMGEALTRLQSGQLPPLTIPALPPDNDETIKLDISPVLLGFLALSQVAQMSEPPQDTAAITTPPAVRLPALQLDFSRDNLDTVLGRKSAPDS